MSQDNNNTVRRRRPRKPNTSNVNRMATRRLCKSLSEIFNLKPTITDRLIRLINSATLHDIAEKALDSEDGRLKSATIELPYVGSMKVYVEDNEVKVDSIILEDKYKEDLYSAINKGESPLIKMIGDKLISRLKDKYESLY